MRPEAEPWWRQAEADLETARDTFSAGHWYNASWLGQQVAEKALKAIHIDRFGILPPRTHDLERLGRLLTVPSAVDTDLTLLNPAFDLVRYPDSTGGRAPVDVVTEPLARDHLEAAERVLTWARTELA